RLLVGWKCVTTVSAQVLSENTRSCEYFRLLGFVEEESSLDGVYRLRLELPKVTHSRPFVAALDAVAVTDVVRSGMLAAGFHCAELEREWVTRTETAAAVSVASGVAGLRLALMTLGVRDGSEVIIPGYSCVALANAILALGGTPVLGDIDPRTLTLNPSEVKRRMTERTKAIIAVHTFGMPCSIKGLRKLGVPVIEDCAHGIGGTVDGVPYGGAGDLSVSSFYATKMICGGSGGIVAAPSADTIQQIRGAIDYGDQEPDGRHLNDKMTDVTAVLALGQLQRLDEMLQLRVDRAKRYLEDLASLAESDFLVLPEQATGRIWYRFILRLKVGTAEAASSWLRARGIYCEQPVWDLRGTRLWDSTLTSSATAFDSVLSLPLYPDLSDYEHSRVVGGIKEYARTV
ncbi:DegT/DnrJ/EryC1/StrS family aminotransferase, partial [Gammaproteobacteria bacterium]|nr:DegT/DnrJ/EryC1/StrS family aminotransferase [Gammaproteobacteria bacterium]